MGFVDIFIDIFKFVGFPVGTLVGAEVGDVVAKHMSQVRGQLIFASVTEQVPASKLADTHWQLCDSPLGQANIPDKSIQAVG
jgi:hypothetical protein